MTKKKKQVKFVLTRNFRDHVRFLHKNPPQGKVFCSRCGNVYCRRNVTPSALLSSTKHLGKLRQQTCDQMIRDPIIPVDSGIYN